MFKEAISTRGEAEEKGEQGTIIEETIADCTVNCSGGKHPLFPPPPLHEMGDM